MLEMFLPLADCEKLHARKKAVCSGIGRWKMMQGKPNVSVASMACAAGHCCRQNQV